MLELRAKLVEDGQSLPQHRAVIEGLRKEHNTMQELGAKRGKWADGLDVKILGRGEKAEVVFHAGCRFSYDANLQHAARTAVTVLKDAGTDIGIMGAGESCCGTRAYGMGYRKESSESAERLIDGWTKAGIQTVVTSCSDCYQAFKRRYPEKGSGFKVLHTVELFDRLIKAGELRLTQRIPMTVTYHDPCHLGRQGEPHVPWDGTEKKIKNQIVVYEPPKPRNNGAWGVYDPPRDVLKSVLGLELVEMERNREYAWCCGASGGVREAYPDFANWTAGERIQEAMATGADAIVSACPWCERSFIDSVKTTGDKIKVLDIAEIVRQAM
jgi:Fe-S oxidoreductase